MNWNEHAQYYDWEFDLICTSQKRDIRIWKALADEFGGPILELCCGSGRITEVLANKVFEITAIDNSPEMLKALRKKDLTNVEIVKADIRNFKLREKFKFAFISYSSFQQLLTLEDQLKCLNSIHKHLQKDGILALDINPRICEGEDYQPRIHSYTAEYPRNNLTISMFTSHRIDRVNQVKHWRDDYLEVSKTGEEKQTYVEISLKECSLDYMKLLFEKCGYEIVNIFGDFDRGKVTEESNNLIYVVRKIN